MDLCFRPKRVANLKIIIVEENAECRRIQCKQRMAFEGDSIIVVG